MASPPGFGFQTLAAFTGFAVGLKNTSGFMKLAALPASTIGSSLNVALVVTPALAGNLSLIMSIDLIGKNRDPGPDDYEEREPEADAILIMRHASGRADGWPRVHPTPDPTAPTTRGLAWS